MIVEKKLENEWVGYANGIGDTLYYLLKWRSMIVDGWSGLNVGVSFMVLSYSGGTIEQ